MCLHSWIFSFSLISFLHVSRLFTNVFPLLFPYAFYFPSLNIKNSDSSIILKYFLGGLFVAVLSVLEKRRHLEHKHLLNIILQLYLIKENTNSLKMHFHVDD